MLEHPGVAGLIALARSQEAAELFASLLLCGGALGRLGYNGISDVRQGKRFELEVDDSVADETVAEIAESLLANIVIEDWSVSREQS